MLGTPPNPFVLWVLGDGPTSLADLQAHAGSPGSTLRVRLKDLVEADVIAARHGRNAPQGCAEYELTESGEDLLRVVEVLRRWLDESPNGSRPFGGDGAKAAINALLDGWSATVLRALAAKPHSIADLDVLIGGFNYPSLERRIAAMRVVGQVEARPAVGRKTPYGVTPWLRRAIAPLLAAIRWEAAHLNGAGRPIAALDVEAVLLLAMPLLRLEGSFSESCRLAVELPAGRGPRFAGVRARFENGALASCTTRLDVGAESWAAGSVATWLRALIDGDLSSLDLGGDGRLARALVGGLHDGLFTPTARNGGGAFAPLEDLAEPAL